MNLYELYPKERREILCNTVNVELVNKTKSEYKALKTLPGAVLGVGVAVELVVAAYTMTSEVRELRNLSAIDFAAAIDFTASTVLLAAGSHIRIF
jgi:hypothetical protein